jgi:hypothetical protein
MVTSLFLSALKDTKMLLSFRSAISMLKYQKQKSKLCWNDEPRKSRIGSPWKLSCIVFAGTRDFLQSFFFSLVLYDIVLVNCIVSTPNILNDAKILLKHCKANTNVVFDYPEDKISLQWGTAFLWGGIVSTLKPAEIVPLESRCSDQAYLIFLVHRFGPVFFL